MKVPPVEYFTFAVLAILAQCAFLILYYVFTEYETFATDEEANANVSYFYKMELDVGGMIFVGFGFLMTFLKKYGYSSMGMNFFIAALACQWGVLTMGFWHAVHEGFHHKIQMSITWLVEGNFAAATVLISFGAVLGKVSPTQLLVMMLIELVFYSLNFYIGYLTLLVTDAGGSMFIHSFGAYFGLACSFFLTSKPARDNPNQGTKYNSDLFSIIGTIFLWLLWPSFNGALVTSSHGRFRVIVNTTTSLLGSCSATFITSRLLRGKWEMEDIQNATVAGGVAIGATADLILSPGGALTIGLLSGIVSTTGYVFLSPLLRKYLYLHDTCGVHNLHAMPGVLGALSAIVATGVAVAKKDKYGSQYADYNKHGNYQAAYQLAALAITIGISLSSGAVTGLILRWLVPPKKYYTDTEYWHVPDDEFLWDHDDAEQVPSVEAVEEEKNDVELPDTTAEEINTIQSDISTPVSTLHASNSTIELIDHHHHNKPQQQEE
jgi:ammonium transporter Rh